jgi:hypothetical protein
MFIIFSSGVWTIGQLDLGQLDLWSNTTKKKKMYAVLSVAAFDL